MDIKTGELKEVPTLEGMLDSNRKLIFECLDVTRTLYGEFTADAMPENNIPEPTCIMADIVGQNNNLKFLLDILLSIKNQVK